MAFHSYTHLIQKLFNAYWCGPSSRVTGTSPWTCVDHSVSRLPQVTHRALFRLAFATAACVIALNLATLRQLVGSLCKRHAVTPQGAPTACRRMVSGSLSLPCAGCFSPFPHGTGTLSVSYEYLALPDGPGGFTQDSTCPALLRILLRRVSLRVRSSHALWPDFPDRSTRDTTCDIAVLQPPRGRNPAGLGCSPFARHYSGNHSFVFSSCGY